GASALVPLASVTLPVVAAATLTGWPNWSVDLTVAVKLTPAVGLAGVVPVTMSLFLTPATMPTVAKVRPPVIVTPVWAVLVMLPFERKASCTEIVPSVVQAGVVAFAAVSALMAALLGAVMLPWTMFALAIVAKTSAAADVTITTATNPPLRTLDPRFRVVL